MREERTALSADPSCAPGFDIDAILSSLLSRLDADQVRAFRRKMAELDAERQAQH